MRIDYDKIMETISIQFKDILYNDMYYNEFKIHVAKEQDYNRIVDRDPKTIYIVVKFQPASLNYRQYLLPITIYALSEQNKLDACQRLLLDYCMQYNLAMSDDQTTKQFYSTPQVISNFEEVYYGYRSMLYMQGTFLVSKDSNPKKFYYYGISKSSPDIYFDLKKIKNYFDSVNREYVGEHVITKMGAMFSYHVSTNEKPVGLNFTLTQLEEKFGIYFSEDITVEKGDSFTINISKEEIEIIDYQTTCDIMLDSQPFYNTNNFSKSIGKIGTYLINLTAYMVDTPFLNTVTAIPDEDFELAPDGVNTTFYIEIEKTKTKKSVLKRLKLVNVVDRGSIGEFPMVTMVFSQ